MEGNSYRGLRAVEIVEYLCQDLANGYTEDDLGAVENKLGLRLPIVLRDFLLRAGRERVCAGEREICSLEDMRFALLSFYREIADGVMERIFDCLEKEVFTIRIKKKDFCSFCKDPMAHLEG